MSTRRTNIIGLLVEELKRIDGQLDSRPVPIRKDYTYKTDLSNNVFRGFEFLHEVNDFPSVYLQPGEEDRLEIGAGVRFGTLLIALRAYLYSEDALNACEDLADDIEFVVNSISRLSLDSLEITDARVTSLETDEGLFSPYGILNMEILVRYQIQ